MRQQSPVRRPGPAGGAGGALRHRLWLSPGIAAWFSCQLNHEPGQMLPAMTPLAAPDGHDASQAVPQERTWGRTLMVVIACVRPSFRYLSRDQD